MTVEKTSAIWVGPEKPPESVGATAWVQTAPGTEGYVWYPPQPSPWFDYKANGEIVCIRCGALIAQTVHASGEILPGVELHDDWHKQIES